MFIDDDIEEYEESLEEATEPIELNQAFLKGKNKKQKLPAVAS